MCRVFKHKVVVLVAPTMHWATTVQWFEGRPTQHNKNTVQAKRGEEERMEQRRKSSVLLVATATERSCFVHRELCCTRIYTTCCSYTRISQFGHMNRDIDVCSMVCSCVWANSRDESGKRMGTGSGGFRMPIYISSLSFYVRYNI